MSAALDSIMAKGASCQRIPRDEALALASDKTLDHVHKLGQAALKNRLARFGRKATYVLNLAINPSNICDGKCRFCHYRAAEGDAAAYVLAEDDIIRRIAEASPREVHITGGMNRFWPFQKARQLIERIRTLYPAVYIKAYTAVEIDRFARDEKRSPRAILLALKQAGLQSLTGGGAELFSDTMRRKYCPLKTSPAEWLAIHRAAHALGIGSNASMLYGLGESAAEEVDHLLRLREAQDRSARAARSARSEASERAGFSCFIPLAYQPDKTDPHGQRPAPLDNLRIMALARLILDNVPHIKAYWPMIGLETAAAGLSWGADDLDGTLGEERIAHAGDARSPSALSAEMMRSTIRLGGFMPVERDGEFNPVESPCPPRRMNLNIAMIPYANMAPVRNLGCPEGFAFTYLTPRQSVDALTEGRVVAAALPTGALLEVGDQVEPLGHYGVAASREVGSVFLYSKKKIELLGPSDRIHLTGQSATSVLLLYLILREKRGQDELPSPAETPRKADLSSVSHEAELIIGDDALGKSGKNEYPFRYDLASLWHERFGKPMVFCRWVVRRDASPAVKARLRAWLGNLDTKDGALVAQSAANEARRLGIPAPKMVAYLKGMRRVLNSADLAGQACFLEKAKAVFADYLAWRNKIPSSTVMFSAAPAPAASERPDRTECLRLLRDVPLGELMAKAHAERMRRHPGGLVSFVMDTNPNYTNICDTRCAFCAFHRNADAKDAYTLTAAELSARVRAAADQGATTVLLQGGLHRGISLARMVGYIREIHSASPGIHIHPFSPPEIDAVARRENKPVADVLKTLWDEGIHTIPGGGAEILSDRVRRIVSPAKCSADRWIEIMTAAHRIGFRTTATMMYGHVETGEDIVEHLLRLRAAQDRTGGFSSFIAWSFKPGHSPLSATVPEPAHPALYVRIIALARLALDNFEHVQSSWFSESENAGNLGLMGGADDFGGILVEENVLRTTGHAKRTTVENVKALIRRSGFVPARRDSDYRILEVYD